MAEEGKKSSKEKPANEPYRFLKLALSGTAVFAAATYILGRLRTEAYYNALGISPGILSFGPEDYMFSSINLVIICVTTAIILYLYYRAISTGAKTFLGIHLDQATKSRKVRVRNIAVLNVLFSTGIVIFGTFFQGIGWSKSAPGITGAAVGLAIGLIAVSYMALGIQALVLFSRFTKLLSRQRIRYVVPIVGVLILLGLLPSISRNLAEIEAKTDVQTFPTAVIICENALHPQLRSSPQSNNESVEVRIITTNNDMTYVLKQDVDSYESWQIYGIQNRNIEIIVFTRNSS